MPTSTYQTVADILSAMFKNAKESSTTLNLQTMGIQWVNEAIEQVMLRKKRPWIDENYQFQTTAKFTPTTFTVSSGGLAVVAVTTGTLPATGLDLYLKINGFDEVYNVDSIAGVTATLEKPYLGDSSTAATGFIFQGSFVLDEEIETVHQVSHAYQREPLQALGPLDFFALQARDPSNTDYPTHWCLFDDSTDGTRRIFMYPAPHSAITMNLQVKKYVPEVTLLTDEPRFPIRYRQTLMWYCLYKLFSFHRNKEKADEAMANFGSWLMRIDNDFQQSQDVPELRVNYARPSRRMLYGRPFDKRYRDS